MEYLTKRDEVVIFYTQNRCGLTFELHQRLISCDAKLRLMEVTALSTRKNTVKNALDLQLSMYIGYLIGSRPKERLYIISKDTDFDLNQQFYDRYLQEDVHALSIYSTIENAMKGIPTRCSTGSGRNCCGCTLRIRLQQKKKTYRQHRKGKEQCSNAVFRKSYSRKCGELLDTDDKQAVNRICAIITASEDLLTLNNLLSRYYHDGKQVKDMYHKLKPSYKALRKLANGTK